MIEIISRKEAKEKGLKRYFTGIPCKDGHIAERYTKWGHCSECKRLLRRKNRRDKGKNPAFHKYRPRFKLICYGCNKEIIRQGQKLISGALVCMISDTYKERNYCSTRCQQVWYRETGKKNEAKRRRYAENPAERDKLKAKAKIWREENKGKKKEMDKQYYKNNREKVNAYKRNWGKNRRDTDYEWRLTSSLRWRLWYALSGRLKTAHTLEFLGSEISEVVVHLEEQFQEGMSWDNYKHEGWQVDHIRPCNSFDLNEVDQQFVCFNWRNLQPMWGVENMSKQDDYSEEDEKIWVKRMKDLGFEGELFLKY